MEKILAWAGMILGSYLLGAVPFALLAGRLKGLDLRMHGSGNLGATNAVRVLGKPVGLSVFFLDFLKGLAPVLLARSLFPGLSQGAERELLAFLCGLAAVMGHIFPVYIGFRGGKGVATTAGIFLALRWDAALISFLFFICVRKITGYVSLSSLVLAFSFPLAVMALHRDEAFTRYRWLVAGASLLALLILWRHRSNLVRIIRGQEPKKSSFFKKGNAG